MILSRWLAFLNGVLRRDRANAEAVEELRFHVDMETEANVVRGMTLDQAHRAAVRDLGGLVQTHDAIRAVRLTNVDDIMQDVRQALRLLRRAPVFAFGAAVVLGLAIGLITSLLSFASAMMFRPWQVPNANSVVVIRAVPGGQVSFGVPSIAEYRYFSKHTVTFTGLAAWRGGGIVEVDNGGRKFRVTSAYVNADYFRTLRVSMERGSGFAAADEDYATPHAVAIISDRLWSEQFARDPAAIGHTITVADVQVRVVGVAASGFADVEHGAARTDLWMPLPALVLDSHSGVDAALLANARRPTLTVLAGRLRSDVTRAQAAAELTVLSRQFRQAAGMSSNGIRVIGTRPVDAAPGIFQNYFTIYVLILAGLIIILLLACADVGNLLLARALARQREIAVRLSLGATRSRVVRQLMVEALVLSGISGAIGLGFAFALPIGVLKMIGSYNALRASFYQPDAIIFGIVVLVAGLTATLAGLAPALRATRGSVALLALDHHGHTSRGAGLRLVLLGAQIALSTSLLVGAGLLTRAVHRAASPSLEPGVDAVETITITMPPGTQGPRRAAFFRGLRDELERTDISPVAFSEEPPYSDSRIALELPADPARVVHLLPLRPVSGNYFAVLGIPIVEGRTLGKESPIPELVISETAARMLWPGEDAVGKTVLDREGSIVKTLVVVGVAKDVTALATGDMQPDVYSAPEWFQPTLLLDNTSPGTVARIKTIAVTLEPRVIVSSRPLSAYLRDSLSPAVLGSHLAWAIGGIGLVLATVGVFGVFAFAVEERRREIGIRLALGAQPWQVISAMWRTSEGALLGGLVAGLGLSAAGSPLLRHFLFGLSPFDPIAYLQVGAILGITVVVATWIPARRATAVDPAVTLRCD